MPSVDGETAGMDHINRSAIAKNIGAIYYIKHNAAKKHIRTTKFCTTFNPMKEQPKL